MRTNYVLIDYESVQPDSLAVVDHEHFKTLIFIGASQAKVPTELAVALQRMGPRAEYVRITGSGRNALDFHIAFYIGQLAAEDPKAYFHVISKDTGFDLLIQHMKTRKIFAGRVKSIDEIPLVRTNGAMTREAKEIESLVKALEKRELISIEGNKIGYSLPAP
jgi:hypothetical protein